VINFVYGRIEKTDICTNLKVGRKKYLIVEIDMYKQVETDQTAVLDNGVEFTPVATLADEYGGRCQISIDDHCYILRLKQSDGRYKTTAWIFLEAFEVLKNLPSLQPA
jgi:hypothetical protein